jgi:hypothetical protein
MNVARKSVSTLGGIFLAALLIGALAPRATRAIAAALVQITNTSADPVPTYDSGTRFQAAVCNQFGSVAVAANNCAANTSKSFVVPTVTSSGAAVKRLIVEKVSGQCSSYNNPNLFIKAVGFSGNFVPDADPNGESPTGESATHYVPIVGAPYSYVNDASVGPPFAGILETDYTYGQVTRFSFNPGDTVVLFITYYVPSFTGDRDLFCSVSIDGYLATQ